MAVEIIERSEGRVRVRCGFCRGTGKDPFGQLSHLASCQVCGGSGDVLLREPIIQCAFCGGTGVHFDTRNTCLACHGRGVSTLAEPRAPCPACEGSGRAPGRDLHCLTCNGTGMVAVKEPAGVKGDS
ncbi:MAG: hypothetical protein ACE5JS_23445 [Nitrospinota bacterium]